MTDNPFTKRYQKLDNSELLDILDFPDDFQPLAVDAARLEIESRQLTPEQLAEAKAKQQVRQEDSAKKIEADRVMKDEMKSKISSIVDTLNPIQAEALTTNKQIKLVVFFLGALFVYHLFSEFSFLIFMISDSSAEWDVTTLIYIMPPILLPTAAILLWLRKKIGWTLAVVFFSYTAAGAVPLLLMGLERSGISAFDAIFPVPSPLYFFGTVLLYGGLIWTLCRENIKAVYEINLQRTITAIGIGVSMALLVNFVL